MDRRKKSRENREQLRCCNWIRLPIGPIVENLGGEGGKKERCRTGILSQEPEYLSGSPHSVAVALCATRARLTEARLQQKLLREKKNESWAMRRFENVRGLTSPTLGVGGNLLCKIVQFGFFVLGIAGILPAADGMLPAAVQARRFKAVGSVRCNALHGTH